MADRGIIFSGPMVRALLDGRKTQTRRQINPQPAANITSAGVISRSGEGQTDEWSWLSGDPTDIDSWGFEGEFNTRYRPGDRLYVREAWHVRGRYSDVVEVGYAASQNRSHSEYVKQVPVAAAVPGKGSWPDFPKFGPSIHMPRWASRLTLTVEDVRVERLQAINEADAIAEGIESYGYGSLWGWIDYAETNPNMMRCFGDPRESYRSLWEALHGLDSWKADPFVVAVTFRVERANIDRLAA